MESVVQSFLGLHFEFAEQMLAASLPMVLTVVVHGQAMHWVGRYFRRRVGHQEGGASSRGIVPIVIVAMMMFAHFMEISGWAIFYVATGMLADARSAMNFSINAYTTLGASDVSLPVRWQGLDGFEAMTAMLMFGWSTAVLATTTRPRLI